MKSLLLLPLVVEDLNWVVDDTGAMSDDDFNAWLADQPAISYASPTDMKAIRKLYRQETISQSISFERIERAAANLAEKISAVPPTTSLFRLRYPIAEFFKTLGSHFPHAQPGFLRLAEEVERLQGNANPGA